MDIELNTKPKKGAIIIEGFPGFGLVGTIAAEFLIDHLEAKPIGKMKSQKISPIIALHKGEIIEPLGIFYSEKSNVVIVRAISPVKEIEWETSKALGDLFDQIKAKEIIAIEGVGSENKEAEPEAFFYTNDSSRSKKFDSMGIKKLNEGVLIGISAALLANRPDTTCIFSEAFSNVPDSRAAAKVVEVLNGYLNLKMNNSPLLKKAQGFEKKVKGILTKSAEASAAQQEKEESYFG